jgi:hypothetical protein
METASFFNLIEELKGALAADIALLGLGEWVTRIESNNNNFVELSQERFTEMSEKTELRMKDIRKGADPVCRSMFELIEALRLVNGDENYAKFVRDLNLHIDHFNNLIAQRQGRNKKKNESSEDTEE